MATTPHFQLLLHGHDGSIPYLTPQLLRLVFCPTDDGKGLDDDVGGQPSWHWRRRHFILGVAVKDTCVVPVYREAGKRKDSRGNDRPAKRARARGGAVRETANEERGKGGSGGGSKKPVGYSFITPSQSSKICAEIRANLERRDDDRAGVATGYMHTHLRIPPYISTMIVPTFSFDRPNDAESRGGGNKLVRDGKHVSKKQDSKNESKQKNQQRQQNHRRIVVPESKKDSMPVDSVHGWQRIGPEQYWDAVISLTQTATPGPESAVSSLSIPTTNGGQAPCEGAVGLFDHTRSTRLVAGGTSAKRESFLKRLVQRTNEWTCRTASYQDRAHVLPLIDLWTPVHLAAWRLPLKTLGSCPRTNPPRPTNESQGQRGVDWSRVAIVGWDSAGSTREGRREALQRLTSTLRSSFSPPRRYALLAVNDLWSVLDAARAGISIIGTDLVRQWSLDGKALCLDLPPDIDGREERSRAPPGGMMDLRDKQWERDFSPILQGRECDDLADGIMAPSFTRAYVHHLMRAQEMLAQTLLFAHNLHQMLLLFRRLSEAASRDPRKAGSGHGGGGEKGHLEAFCQMVEEQLRS